MMDWTKDWKSKKTRVGSKTRKENFHPSIHASIHPSHQESILYRFHSMEEPLLGTVSSELNSWTPCMGCITSLAEQTSPILPYGEGKGKGI